MTAVTEQILDTAKRLGETSAHGRLCPPFLACLDELPSTAPMPTLSTRMANERALGLSFILAAQTWRQFVVCYGEDEARTIYGLSNNLVVFGGGKDIRFYQRAVRPDRRHHDAAQQLLPQRTRDCPAPGALDQPCRSFKPAELRRIQQRQALVLSETHDPIIARLHRCIDGRRRPAAARAAQRRGPPRPPARARPRPGEPGAERGRRPHGQRLGLPR